MGPHVRILLGALVLAAACDSHGPTAPTAEMPRTPAGPTSGSSGPSGPTSNPAIAPNTLVEGTVDGSYLECFPDWDATGHCRQYNFVANVDGIVVATLTWVGPSRGLYDPDVFLVGPDGAWEYAADAWPEKHVGIRVRNGLTYRVVVMSYGATELSFGLVVRVES